jgi:hypothetical protein
MIRYPQGIPQEGNNGTIRRSGKADEGKTGRDSGSGEAMGYLRHKLIDILVIGLSPVITRGEGFDGMEELGRDREERFRQFLELPHGIPDEDAFRRIFERLNPAALMKCPRNRLGGKSEAGGRQAAADGLTIRGSGQEGKHQAVHLVSAWVNENSLHWMPDVNFREDGCRARKDNSPKNLNILRKIALSRQRAVDGGRRMSVKRKMLRAGLAPEFLQNVLFGE